MDKFFEIELQSDLFGWVSGAAALLCLFIGTAALLGKPNKNHVYSGVIVSSYLLLGAFLFQFLFIPFKTEDVIFPYLQFARTALMILGGAAVVWTLYYIFRSVK